MSDSFVNAKNLQLSRNAEKNPNASKNAGAGNLGNSERASNKSNSLKKNLKKIQDLKSAQKLLKYVKTGDWIFYLCMILAVLKDLLDLLNALPAIGQVLVAIIGFLISTTIFLLLLLTDTPQSAKKSKNKIKAFFNNPLVRKFLPMLIGATLEEFALVIDVLPMETLAIGLSYYLTLVSRRDAEENE